MPEKTLSNPVDLLKKNVAKLSASERKVLEYLNKGQHISRNTNVDFEQKLTLGLQLSDRLAAFGGSWTFIVAFLLGIAIWVLLNTVVLPQNGKTFDPFPFILLNLFLSLLAAIQAPVILMAQGRQEAKDRLTAQYDYEVDLKAELEIMALHEKMDSLLVGQWEQLMALQEKQLSLLESIEKMLRESSE